MTATKEIYEVSNIEIPLILETFLNGTQNTKARARTPITVNDLSIQKNADILLKRGFLEKNPITKYQTTDLGLKFLQDYYNCKDYTRNLLISEIINEENNRNVPPDVTIIIPTLNEEKTLSGIIMELKRIGCENIIVVDGNSKDNTLQIAKQYLTQFIIQNGEGKGTALREAFENKFSSNSIIAMMDADGSMRPQEIPLLIDAIESGADIAKGSRFMPGGYSEDMNFIRRVGNLFFIFLVNLLFGTDYTDLCYGFMAFKKTTLERLLPYLKAEKFEIETEMMIKSKKMELKVTEIPSIELRRSYGKSNLSIFKDGFRILRQIIMELW